MQITCLLLHHGLPLNILTHETHKNMTLLLRAFIIEFFVFILETGSQIPQN